MLRKCTLAAVLAVWWAADTSAFSSSGVFAPRKVLSLSDGKCRSTPCSLAMVEHMQGMHSRRQFFGRFAALTLAGTVTANNKVSAAGMDGAPEVDWYRPPSVTNGNYTGLEWQGPTWKKPEGEPSISYSDFLKALKAGELAFVDFVGYSGEKVYARYKATPDQRIRVGEGLPDETSPPPKTDVCQECEASCKPSDKTCSCLSACGGKKDWNSPIYLAKVVKRFGTPFRYSQNDNDAFGSLPNRARRFMMFEGPMSAGLI